MTVQSISVLMVDPHSITVPEGRRNSIGIEQLAASIEKNGFLINPITVTQDMRLVAGARRLAACKLLKWDEVPVIIRTFDQMKADLAEIDENLERDEGTVLWRGEEHARRKAIHLAMYPETAHGGDRKSKQAKSKRQDDVLIPFTEAIASKTGKSRRTVERLACIGECIVAEARDLIRETPVADKQSDLLKLTKRQPKQQKRIAKLIGQGKAKGVRQAENILAADEIAKEPSPLPEGPFRVIAVDPPWAYDNRAEDASHRAGNPYPSMTALKFEQEWAPKIKALAHDDCVLWLWVTNAHMPHAFSIVEAAGFEHKTILTWVKDRMGTGDWLRGQTEHCIMAVRGKPPVVLTNQTTCINGPMRKHSRKPDSFYELVESLCPAPDKGRLELFLRGAPRPGWVGHGNEAQV